MLNGSRAESFFKDVVALKDVVRARTICESCRKTGTQTSVLKGIAGVRIAGIGIGFIPSAL
jgi:hypothetical protein